MFRISRKETQQAGMLSITSDAISHMYPVLQYDPLNSIASCLSAGLVGIRDWCLNQELRTYLHELEQVRHIFLKEKQENKLKALIDFYDIRYELVGGENIPADGQFVMMGNHPSGFPEGIIMLDLVGSNMSLLQLMAMDLFSIFDPEETFLAPVKTGGKSNLSKLALDKLQTRIADGVLQGKPFLCFPAGEISKRESNLHKKKLVPITERRLDIAWKNTALRVAEKAQRPIIPVFFDVPVIDPYNTLDKGGSNLSVLHAMLHQLRTAKNYKIRVVVGKPIDPVALLLEHKGDYNEAMASIRNGLYV